MTPEVIIGSISSSFQRFLKLEFASSILLIGFTIAALFWANSPYAESYVELWLTELSISFSDFSLKKPLLLWINDGLMAIFFFLIGLEIKREVLAGELASLRKATLPLLAAVGGLAIPALMFFVLQGNNPGSEAWGVPMATDIAFSIGILMLLGSRVPLGLKIFLTAFAIADDLGAILIISFFYSDNVYMGALLVPLIIFIILLILNYLAVMSLTPYILGGIVMWYFFLKSGIHPTIVGVIVAFIIPANQKFKINDFIRKSSRSLGFFSEAPKDEKSRFLAYKELRELDNIKTYVNSVQPPLQRLEHNLHGFVAFVVMPIFALANAGVLIGGGENAFGSLSLNIALSLIIGKVLGITIFSWIGVKMGICELPQNTNWKQIIGAGFLGGIGFTMSLFIANLGLSDELLLNQAKLGILLGSLIAGILGYFIIKFNLPKANEEKGNLVTT